MCDENEIFTAKEREVSRVLTILSSVVGAGGNCHRTNLVRGSHVTKTYIKTVDVDTLTQMFHYLRYSPPILQYLIGLDSNASMRS